MPHYVHGDGACLFRAIAVLVYGDEECHSLIREEVVKYEERHQGIRQQLLQIRAIESDNHAIGVAMPQIAQSDSESEAQELVLQRHISRMSRRSTYGEWCELLAASKFYRFY